MHDTITADTAGGACLVCRRHITHRTSAYAGRPLFVCLGHPPRSHTAARRVVVALEERGFALVERFGTMRCPGCGTCDTPERSLEHEVDGADCRALQAERTAKHR